MSEVSLALYLAVFGVLILHRDPAVRKTRTITWIALLTSAFLNCESSKWTWDQHNQSKRPSHKLRNTKSHSTNTRWAETLYIHTYIHIYIYIMCVQSQLSLCSPVDYGPSRLVCPWNFPGKNIGTGCHFLLQGIFLTQESNPHLLSLLLRFFTTNTTWETYICMYTHRRKRFF